MRSRYVLGATPPPDLWSQQAEKLRTEQAAREAAYRATPLGQVSTAGSIVLSLVVTYWIAKRILSKV